MRVIVDGYAWLNPAEMEPVQLDWIKRQLTLIQSVSKEYQSRSEAAIVPCYVEDKERGLIGIAREFFFEKATRNHQVEYQVSMGDEWPDRKEPEKLEDGSLPAWAAHRSDDPKQLTFFDTEHNAPGSLRDEQSRALELSVSHLQFRSATGGIIQAPTAWGKCFSGDTFVIDGKTGRRLRIHDLVGQEPVVLSLDDKSVAPRRSSRVWSSGRKQCAKLILRSGQWLEASFDHPVLAPSGYRRIEELVVGDFVAVARSIPEPIKPLVIKDEEVLVAAALIADGSVNNTGTLYCKGDRLLVDAVIAAANGIEGFSGVGADVFERGTYSVSLAGITEWTRKLSIRCLSKDKRVPADFFGLSNRQMAIFLRWLWTDGNVYANKPGKIEICLASEGLVDDIQFLLRRFGVAARKSFRKKSIKSKDETKWYDSWRLQVADPDGIRKFLCVIGEIPGKEDSCRKLLEMYQGSSFESTNWDVVPFDREVLEDVTKEGQGSWLTNGASMYARRGTMGRARFLRLCEENGYHGGHRSNAELDVVWERVANILPVGEQDVYDLTVPDTHNVIANGVVAHNTVFALSLIREMRLKTAVLVHRKFLMDQWRKRIEGFFPDAKVGYIYGKKWKVDDCHVVVVMIETIASWVKNGTVRPELAKMFGLVIADEVHRCGAPAWSSSIPEFHAAKRFGISARPKRSDGLDKSFFYHIGPKVYTGQELRLTPKIRRVWSKFKLNHPRMNPSFMSMELVTKIMGKSVTYNQDVTDQIVLALKAGRRILIFSGSLDHLRRLKENVDSQWVGDKIKTDYYIGGMTEAELDEAATANAIFATFQMAKDALDIPPIDTVVLASPIRNPEQPVGRILRPFTGKKDPVVVDMRQDEVPICKDYGESRDRHYQKLYSSAASQTLPLVIPNSEGK